MPIAVLGISAFYHDSAAVLLMNGEIVAAAHEERFTRKKHDASFPFHAVRFVLAEAGLKVSDLSVISFYDKPYLKFERLLETYHAFAPKGLLSFLSAMPVWIKDKLFMRNMVWRELERVEGASISNRPKLLFSEHHLSHAASCFYPSPFDEAAILTIDGVGEWATTTISHGKKNSITVLKELHFPHSVGLLYSAFTYYCGFKVNSGEYKLMGLAPYGNGDGEQVCKYKKLIFDELVDLREDGSLLLNMQYFDFATGSTMCKDRKWEKLFTLARRIAESELTQAYMDMALAIQEVTEEIVQRLVKTSKELTGCGNLVLAGGVALNCVANGKLLRGGVVDDIWIQPAAGDAGGALGAALAAYHVGMSRDRTIDRDNYDAMKGSYLGPEFSAKDVKIFIRKFKLPHHQFVHFDDLCGRVSELLDQGQVVGWFQGRMEWGPRALGNRSILGDPRNVEMQKRLNLKIKYREGFRPFAPSVLIEDVEDYFELETHSPYMLMVAPVQESHRISSPKHEPTPGLYNRLYQPRSDIPAVTHVDYSARVQTVHRETNERYWQLISTFKKRTGCGLVINTSFNVRGEPIVCTPEDAYQCFMRTEMDWLVIGDFLFNKQEQPEWQEEGEWRNAYELD